MLDMDEGVDEPLGYLLHRVATSLRAEVTTIALEPAGLSFPQYICMRILARMPGQSNADLARDVMVSPQAMNMVVRGLQDRGLVTRPETVASGRSRPAELSREGIALLKRVDVGVREAERHVLDPLTPSQRAEFKKLLAALG
jgi:DNA-binding MarR family transcriptional regulator